MPDGLCRAFTASREYWAVLNIYLAGESQVELLGSTSRRSWELARRLTSTDLEDLRDFYDATDNQPFWFYDLLTSKSAVYDPTGVLVTGRHTVRFEGEWSQVAYMGRGEVSLRLVEVN